MNKGVRRKNKRVLVIAPHPDDETLGCGATLLKHKHFGDKIYWLIVTNISEKGGWEKDFVKRRQDEIKEVSQLYGFEETFMLDFPTTKIDLLSMGVLVDAISNIIDSVKPEVIYLPNRSDVHSDHRKIFEATTSSSKQFRMNFIKKMLMYECLSETEFAPVLQGNAFCPNYFVDISKFLDKKISILKVYKTELKEFPFPRSEENVRALATYRGATANVEAAEAFVLLKEIA